MKAVNYFPKKSSNLDVRVNSEYTFGYSHEEGKNLLNAKVIYAGIFIFSEQIFRIIPAILDKLLQIFQFCETFQHRQKEI